MKDAGSLGRWRGTRGVRRCRDLEDALWADHPAEAIDVPTRFGPTRAYHWPGCGVPLVLLHGGVCTSVVWQPFAAARGDRDVYALDLMGDVGRTEQRAPLRDADDLASWLDDALAGLDLDRVHLVGHSLGGMVALNTAIRRPERLASLVVFDPGGVVKIDLPAFLAWGLPVMLGSFLPPRMRRWIARRKRHPLAEDKR